MGNAVPLHDPYRIFVHVDAAVDDQPQRRRGNRAGGFGDEAVDLFLADGAPRALGIKLSRLALNRDQLAVATLGHHINAAVAVSFAGPLVPCPRRTNLPLRDERSAVGGQPLKPFAIGTLTGRILDFGQGVRELLQGCGLVLVSHACRAASCLAQPTPRRSLPVVPGQVGAWGTKQPLAVVAASKCPLNPYPLTLRIMAWRRSAGADVRCSACQRCRQPMAQRNEKPNDGPEPWRVSKNAHNGA